VYILCSSSRAKLFWKIAAATEVKLCDFLGVGKTTNRVENKCPVCPGGVAQWTSRPPLDRKTRVRIPPVFQGFRETVTMLLLTIDVIRIVGVPKREIKTAVKNIKRCRFKI
jgi:hypothetical protein